jgi:uncharacterized membrane protein required for colicin V production
VKIDLAVALLLGFFAILGVISGAISQLAHLAGLIAGFLAARPVAQLAGPFVAQKLGYPPLLTTVGLSFLVFFGAYVVTAVTTRFVLRKLFPEGERGSLNRLLGMILGGGKAAAILFVLLCAVVFLEKPIAARSAAFRTESEASLAMGLARRHNLFANLPQIAGLQKLLDASQNPDKAGKLASDPNFQALTKDPRVKALTDDKSIQRALQSGDWATVLSSARVLETLNDQKISERLGKVADAN